MDSIIMPGPNIRIAVTQEEKTFIMLEAAKKKLSASAWVRSYLPLPKRCTYGKRKIVFSRKFIKMLKEDSQAEDD